MPFAAICVLLALVAFAVEMLGSDRFFKQDANGAPSFAVPAANFKGKNGYEKVMRGTEEVTLTHKFPESIKNGALKIEGYDEYKERNK